MLQGGLKSEADSETAAGFSVKNLLPLYLEENALAPYMKTDENYLKDIDQI